MNERRRIFEEAGGQGADPAPQTGAIDAGGGGASRRAARLWLLCLFVLVALTVIVGGLTRLTDSGLSITEWRPVTGALPPLSAEAWEGEFALYRETSEYSVQNRGMSLDEFKTIYWWEWGHRMLARLVGLVWAAGFAWLLLSRRMPPGWSGRFLLLGALGAAQGAIGWWMVTSGLAGGALDVAGYRLAVHLGLAFVIMGLVARHAMELGREAGDILRARRGAETGLARLAALWLALAFAQILVGAVVAGIDAGMIYTDWPMMAGSLLPPNLWIADLGWRNLLENQGLVQLAHRLGAYLLLALSLWAWLRGRRSAHAPTRRAFAAALLAVVVQALLGIATLASVSPWHLSAMHQITAIAVFVLILRAWFLSGHPLERSVVRGGG